ncbi:hypothetical protein N481_12350 [Pseudoalteromonas luteoviolacea S4047-1]|uniref:Uncharacterized protein n=1 Tax=Pseudoalteromonas luteoviolacea S4054 TaxID=1129367 RepID=A0A0F6AA83_9GAMM|nr:hypothetical protein N479_15685 [Pseudoalteromonas luteoviolacea S4054]KZN73503.1 hypothetical protein N481_12350 [Pseudoalteromonas luteoviolacea S4047-1]
MCFSIIQLTTAGVSNNFQPDEVMPVMNGRKIV